MLRLSAVWLTARLSLDMKLRNVCLTVFGVVFVALVMMMNGLCTVIEAAESDDVLRIDGVDPTDMSDYYAMGEYYPPDTIDTLNVNWVGGRVEIVGYNESYYFVEEAATRQLMEEERLSYVIDGNTFSVFYVESDDTVIDDAYKKLEIRIPKQLSEKIKTVNVNTNGEVVFKNFKAENITVNDINSNVRLDGVYSKNTQIETEGGNVDLNVESGIGYSVEFKSKSGVLNSYIDNGKNSYICGDGTYPYNVKTKSGSFNIGVVQN